MTSQESILEALRRVLSMHSIMKMGWEAEVRVICDIDVLAFVIDKRGPLNPFPTLFLQL
jgi:hypothetical protein